MSTDQNLTNDAKSTEKESHYIVGIGASAGGLEALQKFLSALPPDTGFPFVIIQHLSPDYKSLLGEILGKYTTMPVVQVEDGMAVQPNHVYVIQPGKNMRISNGKLLLSAQREKELNLPIDMFFRSLAAESGAHAIAIVLSGTGSDGTNGVRDIKEHDGMVMVQDIESSKFDGMPRSAMRTGTVDVQATPETLALELGHISESAKKQPETLVKSEKQVDAELMKKVYIILKKVSNINFTHYKQTTILRRIERRMMIAHKDSLEGYVDFLYESPEEVKILSREVLIGVTSFFRDPEYFQNLKDIAIQDILLHSAEDEPIRVWVAGCSTGEEAYSIAILFCEEMETLKLKRPVKIFATDLDVESITTAGKGVYGDNIADAVSPARLSRFFIRKNNAYEVSREIRKMIVFSPHNVFQDPPFGRLNLISCRNMMIYFQPVLQNDLFTIFHQALKDGGYLFLGKSEAIGAFTDAFPVVDPVSKIFTHRSDVRIAGAKAIPYLQEASFDDELAEERDERQQLRSAAASASPSDQERLDNSVLESYMPSTLIINDKNQIVRFYGDCGNFVHLPTGSFSYNVFDLITDALKIPASTILKEAREKKGKVQYTGISFHGEFGDAVITMTATPISKKSSGQEGLYALLFLDSAQRGVDADAVPFDIDRVASQRITDLEQDLSDAQDKLNMSVSEQETVNEELQAANEELLTANEELQSSNEELQSVNEELYTVNSEYQQKLTELADLNDDIANFLSSSLAGIIFVDNKLNIRRYTDYVTTEFSVMDHDIGRSLKFISYYFPTVDITEICDNVLKTLVPDEREVVTSKNKVFFMRVSPYRSTENKILGCVITFIDITKQKQGQVELASTEKKLSAAKETIEAKSDYLSRVAHEIRTPMGTLLGLSKAAKQRADVDSALQLDLDRINETVEYMASIVTDISEAARMERGAAGLVSEPFSLRKALSNVELQVENAVKEAGLTFEVSIDDDFDPHYLGNETSVEQILINFLNNSIKYTKSGAISLKVFEEKELELPYDKASLFFVISDTGIGISKEFLPDVFKPFAREQTGDSNENKSMGLGLSIAKNLIESMGGAVTVESEPGKGTTFTINIRLFRCTASEMNAASARGRIKNDEVSLRGCNALVAEDNSLNRTILCNVLAKEGLTYAQAADGDEAVEIFMAAPEGTFDFILMDMRMPKLDGVRATEQIRNSGKADARTIPVIGVSANGFAEDIRKARESGMDEYTVKPVNREHLIEILKRLKARG